jgi:hypothetical protein
LNFKSIPTVRHGTMMFITESAGAPIGFQQLRCLLKSLLFQCIVEIEGTSLVWRHFVTQTASDRCQVCWGGNAPGVTFETREDGREASIAAPSASSCNCFGQWIRYSRVSNSDLTSRKERRRAHRLHRSVHDTCRIVNVSTKPPYIKTRRRQLKYKS